MYTTRNDGIRRVLRAFAAHSTCVALVRGRGATRAWWPGTFELLWARSSKHARANSFLHAFARYLGVRARRNILRRNRTTSSYTRSCASRARHQTHIVTVRMCAQLVHIRTPLNHALLAQSRARRIFCTWSYDQSALRAHTEHDNTISRQRVLFNKTDMASVFAESARPYFASRV